jgi:hypothetical protein
MTRRAPADATATIANVQDSTGVDPETGAVFSVQQADMSLTESALRQLWSEAQLERLARTYWRFLARVTLGVIHVHYTERERFVVLLFKPLKLLTFRAPEYELDATRGVVRWRIERGVLVARKGRGGRGHLQIELRRLTTELDPQARARTADRSPESVPSTQRAHTQLARVHVRVEVANFYPAIAFGLSTRLYNATQSRIHVIVTSAFLRSLTRLDFPRSKVGRFEPSSGEPSSGEPSSGEPSSGERHS